MVLGGIIFRVDLCSSTSFKRSRRELSSNVAELRSILENYLNNYYPLFISTPKAGKNSLKKVFYWVTMFPY